MAESVNGVQFVVGFNSDVVSAIQDRTLQRVFRDSMYPRLLYRGEAAREEWAAQLGANQTFSRAGLMRPSTRPVTQNQDPTPGSWPLEQWEANAQQYGAAIDTHMPTSAVSLASMYLRNMHQLGLHAGQSMNRVVRDKLFNAYLAGNTVVRTTSGAAATLDVVSLNGLTRRLLNGRPQLISATNPLTIVVTTGGVPQTLQAIGFTPDVVGDEIHGGVLALAAAHTGVTARDPVIAANASQVINAGGGASIDDIASSDQFTMALIRAAISQLRTDNAPVHDDGSFHCHLDPTSESQVFGDAEFQNLNTAIPDFIHYREFALAFILGCAFYRNTEAPLPSTVDQDPQYGYTFAGEMQNTPVGGGSAVTIHRPIFTAAGAVEEKYIPEERYISEAGVIGKVGQFSIMNNGMQVMTEGVRLILRAPLDRFQQQTSAAWSWSGDYPVPTDANQRTSSADFKRAVVVQHGA